MVVSMTKEGVEQEIVQMIDSLILDGFSVDKAHEIAFDLYGWML